MDNYCDVSSIYTASWLQSCPVVKFTDCSWLRGPIKLIIIIQLYRGKSMREGVVQKGPHCSPMSRSAACMEKQACSNSYFTVKKTPLRLITLHASSLQSPFQPQPKSKHFPSIILHPNYIPPTTPLYWLMLRASLCCDTPKKTVLLNVVDEHS